MQITPLEWKARMIGLGWDGTKANIGSGGGFKSYLQEDIPWVIVTWCLAHMLKLSIKDALKDTFFKEIDESFFYRCIMYMNDHLKMP